MSPPRYESCYRSFEMQQWWRDYYCYFGQCGFAAVPGTSIHGWGRAIDFQDQFGEVHVRFAGLRVAHGERVALRVLASVMGSAGQPNPEPWHWESP